MTRTTPTPDPIRHRIMAAVPQRDSVVEVRLRKELFRRGYRYRLQRAGLPGRPDFVFPKYRVAVFVHGCFWHRHEGCRRTTTPKSNCEFWQEKFRANIARDRRDCDALQRLGWHPIVVWECEIKGDVIRAADRVEAMLELSRPDGSD